MATISLRQFGLRAPDPLFHGLTLAIGDGDRLGLIAGNGGGKSTLLRCIAGEAEPSEGEVTLSRGLKLAHVAQEIPETLLDLPLAEAIRRAIPPADRAANGWRVEVTLDAFQASASLHDRPIRALSGGWQRLALIARAWVAEPDALLLDEPTNHLDLEKILLLERWLLDMVGDLPMVIASHDRRFLDAVTTRTLFLRPDTSRLYAHPFSRARTLLAEDDAAAEARHSKDAKEVDRLKRSAAALRNIGINSRSDAAQKKSAQIAQRADSLAETLRPNQAVRNGDIRLANRGTHAKVLATITDLAIQAPDGTPLFRIPRLEIRQGERLVLLGRNGAGKSRLVQRLAEALATPEGPPGIRTSPTVVAGHMDQQLATLPAKETPMAFLAARFDLNDQRRTSLLASAGFATPQRSQPIGKLSPGQKARLALLALRLAEPNFYLLDEPTNHVDIPGQERLEAEILAQEATCLLVSHDRAFVEAIGTRFLVIEGNRLTEADSPAAFLDGLLSG